MSQENDVTSQQNKEAFLEQLRLACTSLIDEINKRASADSLDSCYGAVIGFNPMFCSIDILDGDGEITHKVIIAIDIDGEDKGTFH